VARIRNVWLLGLAILGIGGAIQGPLGYLPLYLRGLGWAPARADGALALFHTASMICVIPIALASDRLGSRKWILIGAALFIITGIALLSVVDGSPVWIAVSVAGFTRDGFMAVFMTMIIETEGVGPAYAGTAAGAVMVFSGIGSWIAPPMGNAMAEVRPGLAFLFWAVLGLAGFVGLCLAREQKRTRTGSQPSA
jgi:MFS family permease